MRIEDNGRRNEIGLTRSEMRFCFITLALVALIFAAMLIDTHCTIRELNESMRRIARNMP